MKKILCCAIAFLLGCGILAIGMSNIIKNKRTVSVRGLAEKEVDADLAVWNLSFSVGTNYLPDLQNSLVQKTKIVEEFLQSHSLTKEDYTILSPSITDTRMNSYNENRVFDYIGKQTILIRSKNIHAVKEASEDTISLLGKDVTISKGWDENVSYYFNGLNEIKPQMIEEATQNARKAAEQFAHDSKSKVGKISSASQGLFSIEDAAPGLEYKKNVRVVTTVIYFLAD